jgi:hypothetical protein
VSDAGAQALQQYDAKHEHVMTCVLTNTISCSCGWWKETYRETVHDVVIEHKLDVMLENLGIVFTVDL